MSERLRRMAKEEMPPAVRGESQKPPRALALLQVWLDVLVGIIVVYAIVTRVIL